MNDDEVVMYIIVNSDLKMGKGKIAAQVGHIVMHIMEALVKVDISTNIYERYCLWRGNSYPKIILKGTLINCMISKIIIMELFLFNVMKAGHKLKMVL